MAFLPQIHAFNPLFRFLEEIERSIPAAPSATNEAPFFATAFNTRPSAPRVNVSEQSRQFLVQAELPGYDQKDVNIEWTDANTLTISGHAQTQTETTLAPGADVKAVGADSDTYTLSSDAATIARPASPASSEKSWQQASVEETADEDAPHAPRNEAISTPAVETKVSSSQVTAPDPATSVPVPTQSQPQQPKYWIRERTSGDFQRSFKFESRVDHENVTASLKNGILNVVIPKAQPIKTRRILVE